MSNSENSTETLNTENLLQNNVNSLELPKTRISTSCLDVIYALSQDDDQVTQCMIFDANPNEITPKPTTPYLEISVTTDTDNKASSNQDDDQVTQCLVFDENKIGTFNINYEATRKPNTLAYIDANGNVTSSDDEFPEELGEQPTQALDASLFTDENILPQQPSFTQKSEPGTNTRNASDLIKDYIQLLKKNSTNKLKPLLPDVGSKLGDYKIEKLLGKGGCGAVFCVSNLNIGREEALKVILPKTSNDFENSDKRFLREIDIISRLEHPNIVRLYNAGILPSNVLWMSMELVQGEQLDKMLEKVKRFSFIDAKDIVCQLLHGLSEAHQREIVHRDIKPANIIITKKQGYGCLVKILDFGLAKALSANEDQNVQMCTMDCRRVMGTPSYMPPEQFTTRIIGPWTDVYPVALIMIELLTGKRVVTGQNVTDIAFKQINEMPTLPAEWKDSALEAVLLKALAKNPADRYQNALSFVADLERIRSLDDRADLFFGGTQKLSKKELLQLSRMGGTQNLSSLGFNSKILMIVAICLGAILAMIILLFVLGFAVLKF